MPLAALLALAVIAAGCGSASDDAADGPAESRPAVDLASITAGEAREFGPAPEFPTGDWSPEVATALGDAVGFLVSGVNPIDELDTIGETGDARLAWAIADILRFVNPGEANDTLVGTMQDLIPDFQPEPFRAWGNAVDILIAWDLPVPEAQYLEFKRDLYSRVEPKWADLMVDGTDIDWRHVSWGGVGIDDRAFDDARFCPCIPALDNPAVTPASEGDWYPDDALIFGLVINGEARAYPKNIMEVHEMVNDTLGGRDIGMPYCTLCGSAQAYLTDELPDDLAEEVGRPVFRTSGLLIRSNKMMFEHNTRTFVDTFRGIPASGPLADAGVVFNQVSVVTATWADWKAEHPDTTIIAEDGGIGRSYDLDPLDGRDDNGPIFPIGDVDPRLPVQEPILGVFTDDGRPIAFHVESAASVLGDGEAIVIDGIELQLDAGGIRALRAGEDAGGHQSFWFAWSQFHPDTLVWPLDYQS
ncbi:MAG: DUF3179 domain-containing (seleno)protein [Actinomycetota bacterium]